MSETPPILVRFREGSFVPANAAMVARCAQHFQADELYRIEFREDRSAKTHKHYFACINEAFKNLPEDVEALCPTPEDLRRRALIVNGYADHIDLVGPNEEAAKEIARHIMRAGGYAIVTSQGTAHRVYIAKSQSMRAMDKKEFQASKQAVLNTISDWIGVEPTTLAANADAEEHHHQPNPIPASDRIVERTDNESPSTEALTGSAGEAPPPQSPGGSTPDHPPKAKLHDRPEQTETGGGGPPIPKNFTEYRYYLKSWLSFVKSPVRMKERFERERLMWSTFTPPFTEGQITVLTNMMLDARAML